MLPAARQPKPDPVRRQHGFLPICGGMTERRMAADTKPILTGDSSQPVSVAIIEGLSNWRLGIIPGEEMHL